MKKFKLKASGIELSSIIMGGSSPRGDFFKSADSLRNFEIVLATALEGGVNTFDCAEAYGDGVAEKILGKVVRQIRDHVVLSSKVSYHNTSAKGIRKSCEASLRNLGTSYIDLYYLHYPNNEVPLEESIGTLMELKEEGKIRAIGLSNFSVNQMETALSFGVIDVLQHCYSLLWRTYAEKYLFPFCVDHDVRVVAYGPLASGLLTGKFSNDYKFEKDDQRARIGSDGLLLYLPEWWDRTTSTVEKLKPFAKTYGVTLTQLAINWVLNRPDVDGVIIGARTTEQVVENIASGSLQISEKDKQEMDKISKVFTDVLPEYLNYYLKMVGTNPDI